MDVWSLRHGHQDKGAMLDKWLCNLGFLLSFSTTSRISLRKIEMERTLPSCTASSQCWMKESAWLGNSQSEVLGDGSPWAPMLSDLTFWLPYPSTVIFVSRTLLSACWFSDTLWPAPVTCRNLAAWKAAIRPFKNHCKCSLLNCTWRNFQRKGYK